MKDSIWQKSGLTTGEELKISSCIFQEPSKIATNLKSIKYIEETDAGIIVECSFNTEKSYKIMINWPSIYCGDIAVHRKNGDSVYARRKI